MKATLAFCLLLHPGTRANVRQILNHHGRTRRGVGNDALTENMVMIFALPKQFARELAQVAFRTLCAFGLQFPLETEDPTLLLFPATFTEELLIGGDSRTIQPEINTHDFPRWGNHRIRNAHDHMQRITTSAPAKVGTAYLASDLAAEGGTTKGNSTRPPVVARLQVMVSHLTQ
jgi:hypothetical protein